MSLTKAFKSNKDEDGDKVSKKDKKKGLAATANVSHVTAEIEGSTHADGISPAAALAKKHQLQYAEQEAAAAAEAALVPPKSFAAHARTDSNASDTSVKSARGGWGRSKSTDDVVEGGAADKNKLKSRKGRKWGFGSKHDDSSSVAEENPITRAEQNAFDDQTPRQSLEILAAPATNSASHGGSYFDDDGSAESPANVDDEYEPSLRGAPPGPRRDAKAVRGILKGTFALLSPLCANADVCVCRSWDVQPGGLLPLSSGVPSRPRLLLPRPHPAVSSSISRSDSLRGPSRRPHLLLHLDRHRRLRLARHDDPSQKPLRQPHSQRLRSRPQVDDTDPPHPIRLDARRERSSDRLCAELVGTHDVAGGGV